MKQLAIVIIVMITAVLLSGCAHTERLAEASTPQIRNEISPQASPTEASDTTKRPTPSPAVSAALPSETPTVPSPTISAELTTETPDPTPSPSPAASPTPTILEELTTEDLKRFLNMKMSEVMNTFGEEIIGTEAVMESHMVFPILKRHLKNITVIWKGVMTIFLTDGEEVTKSQFDGIAEKYLSIGSDGVIWSDYWMFLSENKSTDKTN